DGRGRADDAGGIERSRRKYAVLWASRAGERNTCRSNVWIQPHSDRPVYTRQPAVNVRLDRVIDVRRDELELNGGAVVVDAEYRLTLCLRIGRRRRSRRYHEHFLVAGEMGTEVEVHLSGVAGLSEQRRTNL